MKKLILGLIFSPLLQLDINNKVKIWTTNNFLIIIISNLLINPLQLSNHFCVFL